MGKTGTIKGDEPEPMPSRGVREYRTMTPVVSTCQSMVKRILTACCICIEFTVTLHSLLQEADGDPTLLVVLSDEVMLGHVLRVVPNPIPPLARPPPRDPNTAALRKWFLDLVFQTTAPPAAVLEPHLEPNPPMVSKVLRR